jgi:hypothetical protein
MLDGIKTATALRRVFSIHPHIFAGKKHTVTA